ncbi:hypothetical protein EB834_19055 [Brevibacterium aurantiacum]|uniref:Uncharacterized protein n=1 Tax=Brevibacterium aurantiacum TaxID=273384 RepID=A0A2A3ZDS9_BREAU|nr:hypothetical protein CXR23_12445 [Brevibacterium aurantiacum]RCS76608.1 hypothetical protein CIK72_15470 [Brachybacterium alimentarium]PCC16823.1 hypothetical protein CIK79_00010 [Brevibacterium aurantiacum]PCC43388.1 hypothetical protein CIK65_05850 [Brevibacterium aurantiacum]PCC46194.1 hypothetical protein CIK64_11460 [Brevibacterium aurantiacum]
MTDVSGVTGQVDDLDRFCDRSICGIHEGTDSNTGRQHAGRDDLQDNCWTRPIITKLRAWPTRADAGQLGTDRAEIEELLRAGTRPGTERPSAA